MPRGDRLEVERRAFGTTVTYAHQGIDLGDGTVVHARPDDFRDPFGGGRVIRTVFADGDAVHVLTGTTVRPGFKTLVPAAPIAVRAARRLADR